MSDNKPTPFELVREFVQSVLVGTVGGKWTTEDPAEVARISKELARLDKGVRVARENHDKFLREQHALGKLTAVKTIRNFNKDVAVDTRTPEQIAADLLKTL